jgi:branched-subunit amino acid aminotransferase/4-amino-4-deoxychorismate lyase
MRPIVSLNGRLLDDTTDGISPFDRGFTLGDGVFETIKVSNGQPWYLQRHLDRLRYAAHRFELALPAALESWIADVVHQATTQQSQDAALRITLTRSPTQRSLAGDGAAEGTESPATVTIAAYDPPPVPEQLYTHGIAAQQAAGVRNDRGLLAGFKTTSYAESIIALRDARRAGFDDAIFLDTHGFVSEATTSNVFVVINGALVTPALMHGILPGITRAVVLEIAPHAHLAAAERELNYSELLDAQEAFLTSSLRGIIPLVRVNEHKLGDGVPGEMTHRIMTAYASHEPRT